jgi:glycosyltransferase involved in cell wall biosynthesis
MAENLQKNHGIPSGRIRIVPGGVDLDRFQPGPRDAARRTLGWPPNATILFTARNLEPRMGLENLLEAMKQLSDRHPASLRLVIAGEGSLGPFLRERSRALGLESRVSFSGLLPESHLPLAYQAADLFVLPTRLLEGFGLVTLEALASGCPVLGTPVGGTGEILTAFSPSLLTDGTDPEDLEKGVESYLARPPEEVEDLRRSAAAHVRDRYGWDRMASSVEEAGG